MGMGEDGQIYGTRGVLAYDELTERIQGHACGQQQRWRAPRRVRGQAASRTHLDQIRAAVWPASHEPAARAGRGAVAVAPGSASSTC
jgi:hypothetical protein